MADTPKFRITEEWAQRLGMLLVDLSYLEFNLKRGLAYLRELSWEQAMKTTAIPGRTLGKASKNFQRRVRKRLGDTAELQRFSELIGSGGDGAMLDVRNALAHGMWLPGNADNTMVMNLATGRKIGWKGRASKLRSDDFDALRGEIDEAIALARSLTEEACKAAGIDIAALTGVEMTTAPDNA